MEVALDACLSSGQPPPRETGRLGPPRTASANLKDMTIKRLDHVSVVVDDLAAATFGESSGTQA
jgi:hypothetical protein